MLVNRVIISCYKNFIKEIKGIGIRGKHRRIKIATKYDILAQLSNTTHMGYKIPNHLETDTEGRTRTKAD